MGSPIRGAPRAPEQPKERSLGSSSTTGGRTSKSGPFVEHIGAADDSFEREADRVAHTVAEGTAVFPNGIEWSAAARPEGTVQRQCVECEQEEDEQIRRAPRESSATQEQPAVVDETASSEQSVVSPRDAQSWLAEDDAAAGPGQMRRSEFLAALRVEICASVDGGLSGTGRDSRGCPWIDHWLGYYEERSASQIERALRRYAPESATAAGARDYIPLVAARVRRSAETYASSGEIVGLPRDLPDGATGGGSVLATVGGMFFKARPGGARQRNAASVREQLGAGQALPPAVRSRMEPAFGVTFGGVRLHTDGRAARLSNQLNARAFTLGRDVAFGAGEYQPGTLAGDALIAHELAHVVQQGGAAREAPPGARSMDEAYETDADNAAVSAVIASRNSAGGSGSRRLGKRPGLRSELRLQRCSSNAKPAAAPNLQTDKALRKSWDAAFQEGLALLNQSVKRKGKDKGCEFPGGKPAAEWRFDNDNWRQITGEQEIRLYRVAYEPRKKPHISVDALFDHLERWECDCALFSELTWLYAWRHTLPDSEFDQKFANLRLRPQDTTGLERETHVRENVELGLEQGDFHKGWDEAPVGTKVNWTNDSPHARSPWRFENAVKSRKGKTPADDRYDAHPLGENLAEGEIMRKLAENSEDFPGRPFVITDQTLNEVQAAGAPADFIANLHPLKGQSFIGKKSFTDALVGPAQVLSSLRAQDKARYTAIMTTLFDKAHEHATKEEQEQYVERHIKRHEYQIPK